MKLIVVFLLILSSVNLAKGQDSLSFFQSLPSYLEASVSNDYYFSGENFTYAGIGIKYKSYPLSKDEITIMKTGIIYPNKTDINPKFSLELASIKFISDFINISAKAVNINCNSSIFESHYVEWVKIGLGIGMGGFFSNNNQKINFDVMPYTGTSEMSDKSNEFWSLYILVNIGYSSYKLDPEIVNPLADKMYLFDAASAFEGCINSGIFCRISKNVMFNTAMNFYGYEKYKYQYLFLKLTGGFDVLLFYTPPSQYLTCSVNFLFNYFDLGKTYDYKNRVKYPSLITYSKYGINCGLNYNF
jgi:hypothetical protein